MSAILKSMRAVEAAEKAFKAAKPEDKERAEASLILARSNLTLAMGDEPTVTPSAKMPPDKGESEEDEKKSSKSKSKASKSKKAKKAKNNDDDDENDDEDDDDDEEDEDEEDEKKAASSLFAGLSAITGKATAGEILGTIAAKFANVDKLEREHATFAKESKAAKLDALITAGKESRKITPGNEQKIREMGAEFGLKTVRAFIEAAHPAIDAEMDPVDFAKASAPGAARRPVDVAAQKTIWKKMGMSKEQMAVAEKQLAEFQANGSFKLSMSEEDN